MHKKIRAFTLVELLLVVTIILILAGMVIPRMAGRTEQARRAAAKVDIDTNIAMALDLYELDNGKYPTTEQGLQALVAKPASAPVPANWNGPYLKKKKMPIDPWSRSYIYVSPGIHNPEDYDLYSYGPDGVEGGGDDINNWEESHTQE
ncbi:MAG: type II secretion system major pseudopilin GspG [Candidatus Omnitrophica bacterium]|nr:type II secretion system major pseudopilin GspG [Candidatus Omnitrophota bacterium]HOX54030.1 type II secretion system major pseudopilin GspG [Candidatus Omnitrophota bacterium]